MFAMRELILILLSLCLVSGKRVDLSEKSQLLELKKGFVDHHNMLSSWKARNKDHCSWFGVTCFGVVRNYSTLKRCVFLSGRLLDVIGSFLELRVLSLPFNELMGDLPSGIWGLKSLEVVDIEGNRLTANLSMVGFMNLKSLQVLNLGFNSLFRVVPKSLLECKDLRFLSLAGNRLGGYVLDFLGNFVKLKGVNLALNRFNGSLSDEFWSTCDVLVLKNKRVSFEGATCARYIPRFSVSRSSFGLLSKSSNKWYQELQVIVVLKFEGCAVGNCRIPRGGRTGRRTGRGGGRTRGRSGDQGNGEIDGQGGQVGGRGNEVNDGVDGVPDFSTIIAQQLQNLLPTIVAQVGDQGRNQGNGRNQNKKPINDQHLGAMLGNVIARYNRMNPGSFVGKALTWWNSQIHTRSREAVVGMSWEDFKTLTREEFSRVMKCKSWKLSYGITPWSGLAMLCIRIGFMSWLGMVAATDPMIIQKAMQIASTLIDEALRNGSIKKNHEKRGNGEETNKDRNVRDDNKRTRTGNAFATTINPVERERTWDCKVVPRNVNSVNARNPAAARRACYEGRSTDHYKSACLRLNRAQGPGGNHPNQALANNGARVVETNGTRQEECHSC
ncbi:reverse transcriptase domain-containing protein [Tanacetum coccineum]